jgi:hypothetical protein
LLILFFKWLTVLLAGVYNFWSWIPDLTFAALAFDIWAITSKLKGQTLQNRGPPAAGETDEAILVWGLFWLHLVIYMFNVWVWLTPSNVHLGSIVLKLSALLSALFAVYTPFLVLGKPWP